MTIITFDTSDFIQTLQDAGVDEKQAKATAKAVKQAQTGFATNEHLDLRLAELKTEMAEVRGEIKLTRWMIGASIAISVTIAGTLIKLLFTLKPLIT